MAEHRPGLSSKSRVLRSIDRQEIDRIPVDYWGTPEVNRLLTEHFRVEDFDEVLDRLQIDTRYIYASGIIYERGEALFGPSARYIGPKRRVFEDESFEDLWGVRRKFVTSICGNTYREVIREPLRDKTTVGEMRTYDKWPRAEDFDYSDLRAECKRRKDYALILGGMPGCATVFIQCWYLRGFDQILMDLEFSPSIAQAIIDKVVEFQLEYHRKALNEIGDLVDILMLADDFGTQFNLMISPEHFRKFFKRPLSKLIEIGKDYGLKIMFHSDGDVSKLIPEFVDMGIDILNPIQPVNPAMNPRTLKEKFGKEICLHGGVDTQLILPNLSADEVSKEVRKKIRILGRGGGYILSPTHMIQLDVPLNNVLAMYRTSRTVC